MLGISRIPVEGLHARNAEVGFEPQHLGDPHACLAMPSELGITGRFASQQPAGLGARDEGAIGIASYDQPALRQTSRGLVPLRAPWSTGGRGTFQESPAF
jgi:hypothetical protein